MIKTFLRLVGALGLSCAAVAAGTAKIEFEKTVYDFGKTSQVETVSGVFKFKNTGDGTLKIEPPKPSCGCTVATLKSDTLKPGEAGELSFSVNLGKYRTVMEKNITVTSNDPQTPQVVLTIKADYTPLYDVVPMALVPNLPFGVDVTNQIATVTRTDGKPLHIQKLQPSQPWLTAKVEPAVGGDKSVAQVRIEVRRDGAPRRFNESVLVYAEGETNGPATTVYLYGRMSGEVSVSPEALYWGFTDNGTAKVEQSNNQLTRKLTVNSADGTEFSLKNLQSSVSAVKVRAVPKEDGKIYELVAQLGEIPDSTVSGNISFETSLPNQPRVEVPIIVSVVKPAAH